MNRNFALLIFFILCLACTRESRLARDGVGVRFPAAQWSIEQTSEGTWKVGKHLSSTVSKNLNLVLRLPVISDSDVDFLAQTYGVDAWVVRVRQDSESNPQKELALLWAPFRSRARGRSAGLPMKALSLNFTYAAYAISERLRGLRCPEFSHDRRLREWRITGAETPLEIVLASRGSFTDKLTVSDLVPTVLNVGASMVARYSFEVALYSTQGRQLYSEFAPLSQGLQVLREETVPVAGCP